MSWEKLETGGVVTYTHDSKAVVLTTGLLNPRYIWLVAGIDGEYLTGASATITDAKVQASKRLRGVQMQANESKS